MDKTQFTQRVLKYEAKMYRAAFAILCSESDACDATQEAVAKAYCKRGQLRNEDYFETWLMRILINECRAMLKRQKRFAALDFDMAAAEKEPWLSIDLKAALAGLPEKYRVPMVLYYCDGYTLDEIGAITGVTGSCVKTRLSRARSRLKETLGGDYVED